MYWVYALRSLERKYTYVGLTSEVERRLKEHNAGKLKTTKPFRPFRLIYTAEFPDRIVVRFEEKRLKSGAGKEFLKSL